MLAKMRIYRNEINDFFTFFYKYVKFTYNKQQSRQKKLIFVSSTFIKWQKSFKLIV